MRADVIVDLQYGDCGKGKVVSSLLKSSSYDYCLRFNGGGNCGHAIYHNEEKFITHFIPAGVFHSIPSILGNGCVVNSQGNGPAYTDKYARIGKRAQDVPELADYLVDLYPLFHKHPKGNIRILCEGAQRLIMDGKKRPNEDGR